MAGISKLPNGRYRVVWREDGRQRQKNFKTAAEARKYAAMLTLTPEQQGHGGRLADLLPRLRVAKEAWCKARGFANQPIPAAPICRAEDWPDHVQGPAEVFRRASQRTVAKIHWNLGAGYSAQRNSNAFGCF